MLTQAEGQESRKRTGTFADMTPHSAAKPFFTKEVAKKHACCFFVTCSVRNRFELTMLESSDLKYLETQALGFFLSISAN